MSEGLELSAMVVTPDRRTIATLIATLIAQREPGRIELVVVAPESAGFTFDEGDSRLGACTLVEVDAVDNLRASRAAGIAAASAPVVLIAETHCFPDRDWLDPVLAAHAEGWSVVGPALENANPGTAISWANFVDHYARFWRPPARVAVDEVAGHNSTLSRRRLLTLGDELPRLLRDFPALQLAVAGDGGILLEPAARMHHVHMTHFRGWVSECWSTGRVGAASRARHWSRARRFAYAAGWPALAAVEWWRRQPALRRLRAAEQLPRGTNALLALGMLLRCAGEAVGFVVLSGGKQEQAVAETEIRRLSYLDPLASEELEARFSAAAARAISERTPQTTR